MYLQHVRLHGALFAVLNGTMAAITQRLEAGAAARQPPCGEACVSWQADLPQWNLLWCASDLLQLATECFLRPLPSW